MQNHKVMKTEKLNKTRWILIISSILLGVAIVIGDWLFPDTLVIVTIITWSGACIFSIILLFQKKDTLQNKLRRFLVILLSLTAVLFLFIKYVLPFDEFSTRINWMTFDSLRIVFIMAGTYCFLSYLHRVEKILFGFVFGIILGLGLNRLGFHEAGGIVVFFLALSSFGFIYLAISTIKRGDSKQYKRSIVPFYFVLAVCNAILALKFSSYKPALTDTLDLVGVIVFLLSCVALFITMPFSNFIEWSKSQKQAFQKLILIPFAFFLLVFSLKFLLPDTTYRKIFFKEYTEKEKAYFGMEEYKIEEDN